ncbi:MAG: hypothetical protein WC807_16835 [Hyphomicrobium sp.]|jgi:hypothetical protein
MLKQMTLSVLTQGLASAGNLAVSVLLLRLLQLDDFGRYTFIALIASVLGAVAASMTGCVYQLCRPRFRLLGRSYESAYNGFNLLVTLAATAIAATVAAAFVGPSGALDVWSLVAFVFSIIAADNLKVQAAANGQYVEVLQVEFFRQTALILCIIILKYFGWANLSYVIFLHGIMGTLAVLWMAIWLGSGLRLDRLPWVMRRHYEIARYLLPSTLISSARVSLLQILIAKSFGLDVIGLLRAAELPFGVLNPLKQSLNYFLPRAIYDLEQKPIEQTQRTAMQVGLLALAGTSALSTLAWGASLFVFPLLTHKDYPALLGALFAAAYVGMMMLALVNHYLSVVGKVRNIFWQSCAGTAVTLGVYLATYSWLEAIAAPLATAAGFFVMTAWGLVTLRRHLITTSRTIQQPDIGVRTLSYRRSGSAG